MKKIIYFFVGFAVSVMTIFSLTQKNKNYYSKTEKLYSTKQFSSMKYYEMLYKIKANQITGKIDDADIINAKNQLKYFNLFKKGFPLSWQESGPDNIGGRCRTILIDRNNPNVLYAAGVSGGIFKSTNAGASWTTIDDGMPTLAFQSSCQTVDGTIYFGSGENAGTFGGGGEYEGSVFIGEGIFKSTDGKTFTQLSSTTTFTLVNSMASDPTKNIIYAGTNSNLKYSEDAGTTWKNLFTGACRDVKVASNGNVLAYMGGNIYRSTTPTVSGSYVKSTGIASGFNRLVIAISPQDPNYVYVLASLNNNFGGLFQSKDGGASFEKIVPGGSPIFNPLNVGAGGQGDYDLCVAVHPRNKNRVFMGGVSYAEWNETKGPIELYSGLHADLHWFTFDTISNPMRMYVGNDGGIYRNTNTDFTMFSDYNIGFNVTQFYAVAASKEGNIIGGTQDNGTQHISKNTTDKKRSVSIYGGDGFRCEISSNNPSNFIVESYNGNIGRSQNKGSSFGSILDNRVPRYKMESGTGKLISDPKGSYILSPFNTPIKLSEVDSFTRLFVGADQCIWMVENVFNFSKNPTWFKISTFSNAFVTEVSSDGKYLFAGKNGQLARIKVPLDSNGNLFYLDTLKNLDPNIVYPGCITENITGNFNGRFITGIAVDRSDANRLLVTLGNYGNTNYIYFTENALDAVPTWVSVQGNLPAMPVYDAEFVYDNNNMVIIGTEFGIWGTTNIKGSIVAWQEQNQGVNGTRFPRVATFELRQVENKSGDTGSVIVAATHGRGIWETHTLFAGIKNIDGSLKVKVNAFPNPAISNTTVQFSLTRKDNINIKVLSLTGKLIYEQKMPNQSPGVKNIKINTSEFAAGNYIIYIIGSKQKGSAKIIVQK
ncbi:MAG: T9SS type A sorting domain-containing protein [Bacteroidetes bacterium]|nr:T9SS type A sorting domain-containing protein [Bacteroidota bacterium]